jgi:hypothetical protein
MLRRPQQTGRVFAVSVGAWYLLDTANSLWFGFWPNAVLNTVFALLFAGALALSWRAPRRALT